MLQVSFEQFHVRLLKYGKIDKKLSHHVLLRQKVYLQLLNVVLTILLYLKFNDQFNDLVSEIHRSLE